MSSHDEILEGLPPHHEGEPATLRRDILDELADHLDCAVQREMRRHDDPRVAQAHALERFGNPRQIARRLWLDAMKGQLMNQRILLGTQIVMIIVIAALCVTIVLLLRQNARVQEVLMARMEMLSLKSAPGPDAATLASYDWPTFRVQVLSADGDKAMPDMRVSLQGEPYNSGGKQTLRTISDAEGRAAFGPLRAGGYTLRITTAAGDQGLSFSRSVPVPPGPDRAPLVVRWLIPQHRQALVTPRLELPQIESETPWLTLVQLMAAPAGTTSPEDTWSWPSTYLLFDSYGRVATLADGGRLLNSPIARLTQEEIARIDWRDRIELDASMHYRMYGSAFLLPATDAPGADYHQAMTMPQSAADDVELTGENAQPIVIRPEVTAEHLRAAIQRINRIRPQSPSQPKDATRP